jgi:hypothetical protein
MALYKCLVPPERSGYAINFGSGTVTNQLDGGLGRYRADQLGASSRVNVQWSVGINDYNYLQALFRQFKSGAFLIDLILDHATADEYTVFIVPDSWQLNSNIGITFIVQATLEVQPLPVDTIGDLEILARNS